MRIRASQFYRRTAVLSLMRNLWRMARCPSGHPIQRASVFLQIENSKWSVLTVTRLKHWQMSALGSQGASWGSDGRIVYAPAELGQGLMQVAASGGSARPATQLRSERHELSHLWPKFLPDGKHLLFYGQSSDAENRGTFLASLDSTEIRLLIRGAWAAAFAPPSHVMFVRDGNLLRPETKYRCALPGR